VSCLTLWVREQSLKEVKGLAEGHTVYNASQDETSVPVILVISRRGSSHRRGYCYYILKYFGGQGGNMWAQRVLFLRSQGK
jgi:hypothetical protein